MGRAVLKDVGRALLGRRLAFPDPWDVCGFGSTGRTASSLFLIKKGPFALTKAVEFRFFVPAETLNACALIGLHLMAAQSRSVSSGSQSADLGDARRHGRRNSLTGTATLSGGLKAKALLQLSSASTTWKALLCRLRGRTGQSKRCLSLPERLGACECGSGVAT